MHPRGPLPRARTAVKARVGRVQSSTIRPPGSNYSAANQQPAFSPPANQRPAALANQKARFPQNCNFLTKNNPMFARHQRRSPSKGDGFSQGRLAQRAAMNNGDFFDRPENSFQALLAKMVLPRCVNDEGNCETNQAGDMDNVIAKSKVKIVVW